MVAMRVTPDRRTARLEPDGAAGLRLVIARLLGVGGESRPPPARDVADRNQGPRCAHRDFRFLAAAPGPHLGRPPCRRPELQETDLATLLFVLHTSAWWSGAPRSSCAWPPASSYELVEHGEVFVTEIETVFEAIKAMPLRFPIIYGAIHHFPSRGSPRAEQVPLALEVGEAFGPEDRL